MNERPISDGPKDEQKTSGEIVAIGNDTSEQSKSVHGEPKEALAIRKAKVIEARLRRQERMLAKTKATTRQLNKKIQTTSEGRDIGPIIANLVTPLPTEMVVQRPGEPERIRKLFRSALVFVGIPTLLAIIYFGFIASDQYVAEADFVIKSRISAPPAGLNMLGMGAAPGVGSLPSIADMLVVKQYVASLQILKDLKSADEVQPAISEKPDSLKSDSHDSIIVPPVDIRKMYSFHKADWFARLNPAISEEELLDYWNNVVVVHFDMTTGIATLTVRAFTPDDAKVIADKVLALGEKLVNHLSERSQSDTLAFAKNEVAEANARAMQALDALQNFQAKAKQLDPEAYAKARSDIQGKLEATLSQYQGQLDVLRKDLPDTAPGIQQLMGRMIVLQKQLASEKLYSTKTESGESANEILNKFAKFRLESDFSTQAYISALTSLEKARQDASMQSRYLEAFVRPQLPQFPEYPRRFLAILLVFIASAMLWAIGRLLFGALREHA